MSIAAGDQQIAIWQRNHFVWIAGNFDGTNLLAVNVAPWGSVITVIRTHGASNGGTTIRPPNSAARVLPSFLSRTRNRGPTRREGRERRWIGANGIGLAFGCGGPEPPGREVGDRAGGVTADRRRPRKSGFTAGCSSAWRSSTVSPSDAAGGRGCEASWGSDRSCFGRAGRPHAASPGYGRMP